MSEELDNTVAQTGHGLSLVSEEDPFCLSFQGERPLRSFEHSRERALGDSSQAWLGSRQLFFD